jgi:hypothetical protein
MTQRDGGKTEGKSEENDKRQDVANKTIPAVSAGAATAAPNYCLNVPCFGLRFQINLPTSSGYVPLL